jgi:hypothetical protein
VVRLNLGGLRSTLDKSKVDTELARRFCAAFVSYRLGISIATQYKKTPEEVGDLWYFLAGLAEKLAWEGQDVFYDKLGALATTLIQ